MNTIRIHFRDKHSWKNFQGYSQRIPKDLKTQFCSFYRSHLMTSLLIQESIITVLLQSSIFSTVPPIQYCRVRSKATNRANHTITPAAPDVHPVVFQSIGCCCWLLMDVIVETGAKQYTVMQQKSVTIYLNNRMLRNHIKVYTLKKKQNRITQPAPIKSSETIIGSLGNLRFHKHAPRQPKSYTTQHIYSRAPTYLEAIKIVNM